MVNPSSPIFGPKHVRDLLGIPTEQLRNWRRMLPAIDRERSGQAVFDFPDMLALAVVRCLVVELDIRIGLLTPVAQQLVDACRAVTLEDAPKLRIDFEPNIPRVTVKPVEAAAPDTLAALVPLGPIVKALVTRLMLPPDGPDGLPLFRQ